VAGERPLTIWSRTTRAWTGLVTWLESHQSALPVALLAIGGAFRFYNLNWDSGHQLHPDERGIYMLVTGANGNGPLSWPTSISQFFQVHDPSGGSPLNPHYFAYGSLPYYLLAFVSGAISTIGQHVSFLSAWSTANTYGGLPPIGRALSAILTLVSVYLVFLLGRRVFGYWAGVLAMALSAFTVLDIQLAHFYQSDTVLLPLVLLALIAAVSIAQTGSRRAYLWGAAALGAALATKTTALLLVIPLGAAAVLGAWGSLRFPQEGRLVDRLRIHYAAVAPRLNAALQRLLLAYILAGVVFAILEPYGILDRTLLLNDVAEQNSLLVTNNPPFGVPYTFQYAHTIPYLFQLKNMLFWTLGLPLALAAFAGVVFAAYSLVRGRVAIGSTVLLLWIVPYFLFVGAFFAKFNRYMLPITPVMTILGAAVLVRLVRTRRPRLRAVAAAVTAAVTVLTFLYALAYMNIYANPNTRVAASRWMFTHVPRGSLIAQEGPWDETLPLDENGFTGTAMYRFANDSTGSALLNPYAGEFSLQDEQTKIANLTRVLTQADYIVMSSERMDRSVRRVPDILPIAYRYYQLLFSNRLNFRLVAHFQQHPQLGPIVVHDYSADESFHVYDHPDVRIFKRVASINPARVRTLLTTGLPSFPREDPATLPAILRPVSSAPDRRLILSPKQWSADQRGSTLDQMFPPNGFAMQHPLLVWLVLLELLGLLAFPFTFVLFSRFVDRGFVMAKTLGLLLAGFLVWIVVSVGLWEYTRALVIGAVVALAIGSSALAYGMRHQFVTALRARWRYMIAGEIVFLAAFAFFVLLRMYYPDLGHQYSPVGPLNMGDGRMGEKQMELAFLNAIARSRAFPPLDPFFAHGYINYYYYGFFLVSFMCKLTQIVPATGFNLAIATFGALLLASVFSVVLTLTRRITPAVLAAVLVGVIGNLNGGWQLIQGLMSVGQLHSSFPITGGIVDSFSGLQQVIFNHQPLPQIDFWQSTRIFPAGAISEFPYFTYLFADLHPHLMAYPMCVLAIGIAVNLVRGGYPSFVHRGIALALGGVILGGIAATNPWDFPTYLLVIGLGAMAGAFVVRRRLSPVLVWRPVLWMGSLAALSLVLYLPFKQGYQTVFSSGIGLVRDITPQLLENTGICPSPGQTVCPDAVHDALVTPLRLYLEHFGLLLFLLLSYLLVLVDARTGVLRRAERWLTRIRFAVYYRDRPASLLRARRAVMRMTSRPDTGADGSLLWGVLILIAGLIVLRYYLLAFLVGMLSLIVIALWPGPLTPGPRTLRRVPPSRGVGRNPRGHTSPLSYHGRGAGGEGLHASELFILAIATLGIAISILTQIFFVKDFLAGGAQFRMNTTFKFYDQVWVLFAIAGASAAYFFMARQIARPRAASPTRLPRPSPHDEFDVVGHAYPAGESAHVTPDNEDEQATTDPPTVVARARSPSSSTALFNRVWPFRAAILFERHRLWGLSFVILLVGSLVYTIGGTASRETMRSTWLPQNSVPRTLDGMAFMKVAYPAEFAAISWLNANVSGAPVIAEAGGAYYDWRSRVSMFTGLPTIINGIHEDEQRYDDEPNPQDLCAGARNPDVCSLQLHSRIDDLNTLYSSPSVAQAWRVIRTYGVAYIFKGFAEQVCIKTKDQCYPRAGLAKFDRMVGHGLRVAFRTRGVTIYRVIA
jgi:uncharacterized membrane protein